MAASIPVQPIPFKNDPAVIVEELPNGEIFQGTEWELFTRLGAIQADAAARAKVLNDLDTICRQRMQRLFYPTGYPMNKETHRMDGTDKFELPAGWTLEFEKRINVKIDAAALPSIAEAVAALPVDEETGEVPSIGSAIRAKPEFSASGYGNLRDDVRVILNEALEFTPGTPGIKMVPPKQVAAKRVDGQKAKAKEKD